jgi:hypothetical protein
MTTTLQCIKTNKPYTLGGFEPGIFCSVGGRDDHFATPLGLAKIFLKIITLVPGTGYRQCLLVSIAALLTEVGFDSSSRVALESLAEMLQVLTLV